MKNIKIKPGTTLEKVFNYLRTGHSLDNAKAIAMWGYIRLSCSINQLRNKGVRIVTDSFQSTDGNTVSFYRLSMDVDMNTPAGTPVRTSDDAYPFPSCLGVIERHTEDGCYVEVRTAPDEVETEFYFYDELKVSYAAQ